MRKVRSMLAAWAFVAATVLGPTCLAQDAPFYKNKKIILVMGFPPGGAFDTYGRIVARYWSKHIPGEPTIIPENMPGAGNLKAAEYIYNKASKDGLVVGLVSSGLTVSLFLAPSAPRIDLRQFNWLGSANRQTVVALVWHTAPVQTMADLKSHQLIVGAGGANLEMLLRAAQKITDLNFKIIAGYNGTPDTKGAMEKGEIEGTILNYSSLESGYQDVVRDKKVSILFQYGLTPTRELSSVPRLIELAETEQQRQALRFLLSWQDLGLPFVAPPGVAKDRVELLRTSFNEMVADPAFVDEARKRGLSVSPDDFPKGEDLKKSVDEVYATPPDVIEYVRNLGL